MSANSKTSASEYDIDVYPAALLRDIEEYEVQTNLDVTSSDLFACAQADKYSDQNGPTKTSWRNSEAEEAYDSDNDNRVYGIRSLSQPITFDAALSFVPTDASYSRYRNIAHIVNFVLL